MLNNLPISRKIIVGLLPMILLLLSYLSYSLLQISDVNHNLSLLKSHIDDQASNGTSLFLLNNISRREQLNQQYLISGQQQLLEIIQLLETDFTLLNEEQLKHAISERDKIQQIAQKERAYVAVLRQALWPQTNELNELLEQYNNELGPRLEKLALIVRDLGLTRQDIQVTDIGSRLSASAISARAYFNQYIANKSQTSLERAKLEVIATSSALADFSAVMKQDSHYSYIQLAEYVGQLQQIMSTGEQLVSAIASARVQAEDLSNDILKSMLSQQITQWRFLYYEAGLIQAFMKTYQWQSAAMLVFALTAGIAVLLFISRTIVRSLSILLNRVSQISTGEGDLTKRVEVKSKDETGALANSVNHFIESIHNIVANAQRNSKLMIDKSEQNLANATQSSELLKEQQQKNLSVVSAVEQLSSASSDIAQSSVESNHSVEQTFTTLKQGTLVVEQSVDSVQQLNQKMATTSQIYEQLAAETKAISKVLDVIKNMSEQTNLLALNAAIEAARAGEAGKGFAVVAEEVRALANKTQASADEIDQSVMRLQKQSQRVVNSVNECYVFSEQSNDAAEHTKQTFNDVRKSVERIHSMSTSIATASEQQSQVPKSIRQDIEDMFSFSKSIAEAAMQSQNASKASTDSATELNQVLTKFVV